MKIMTVSDEPGETMMGKFVVLLRKLMPWRKNQFAMYFGGCFIFSFGAKFFIDSKLGVDPLDVLCIGMTKHLPITIGIASGIVAITFLSIWTLWNKKFPPLTPFFTTFLVGNLIDLWNLARIQDFTSPILSPVGLLVFALLLCAYGSSYIIMSGIGIRIMDLVAITIVNKWRWQFIAAKMFLEIAMFSIGWTLGGPIGIGTVCFLAFVGTLIQPFMFMNNKFLRMPNHGLSKATTKEVAAAL